MAFTQEKYASGTIPTRYDTRRILLVKQLNALNAGGGGGGSAQLVTYTSGTPANPSNVNAAALAYDPTGILPTLGWNTGTQTWN